MASDLNSLEDRILILQDHADVLCKKFDPNQPRDQEGKWRRTGSSEGVFGQVKTYGADAGLYLAGHSFFAAPGNLARSPQARQDLVDLANDVGVVGLVRAGVRIYGQPVKSVYLTQALRSGTLNARQKRDVVKLDQITSAELPEPITVYRGAYSGLVAKLITEGVGATFQDKSFVATSVNPAVAASFKSIASVKDAEGVNVATQGILAVHLKTGQRGAFVNVHSDTAESWADLNAEILLPRNQIYRVSRIETFKTPRPSGGGFRRQDVKHVVHVEVLS